MPYATFDEAAHAAAHEAALLVASKQRDYGPNNIMKSVVGPELGIAVRLNDKIARLANLKMHDATPENEALRDTALDIIGYGLVLLMVMDGTFELPLQERSNATPEA